MPKRKNLEDDEDSESGSDISTVIVDFDFCDFKPQIDYVAVKRLLQQLLHTDASFFDLGSIADLIISQADVGTTIKTDGADGDPLAFLAVVNVQENEKSPPFASLLTYLLSKISADVPFHRKLTDILTDSDSCLGLVIGERVYNMPPQVMPPLYKMLKDEIEWAVEDGKPYHFSHLLILSRVWRSTAEEEGSTGMKPPPNKRQKGDKGRPKTAASVYSFHPEDDCIQKEAMYSLEFDFSHQEPRTNDTFGEDIAGRVMLIPGDKLGAIVQDMSSKFPSPS
ncbi:Mss4p nuclear export [Serendipita sp. 401]|nr:Mss4p nuclear export [Serendipita sp. 401]